MKLNNKDSIYLAKGSQPMALKSWSERKESNLKLSKNKNILNKK